MMLRTLLFGLVLVPAVAAAQTPLTLNDAVTLGRAHGVQGEIARLNARAADRRAGEHTGELLPRLDATGQVSRQTNNLSEFGISIPGFPAVTDPFSLYAVRARATQVIFDGSVLDRARGGSAEASAARYDATAGAEASGMNAGLAWLRAVSAE